MKSHFDLHMLENVNGESCVKMGEQKESFPFEYFFISSFKVRVNFSKFGEA